MTLILSGTDGLSDVDGSAATPAIRGTDANTGIFFPAADTIAFSEGGAEIARFDSSGNLGIGIASPVSQLHLSSASDSGMTIYKTGVGAANVRVVTQGGGSALAFGSDQSTGTTERMRIDSSGNVGIGTSSPNRRLVVYEATTAFMALQNSTTGTGVADGLQLIQDATTGYLYQYENMPLVFGTNATERARIDSSGNLLVGTTSGASFRQRLYCNGFTNNGIVIATTDNASGFIYAAFKDQTDTTIGSITRTGTTSVVAYNTSSDYRLKENIQSMTGALATVAQLNPVTYNWKADGSTGQGFIAHELQAVVPDCVTGEKDAVETYTDEEGNEQTRPVYQGIDTSFLVATLTAAIKELKAIVDAQAVEIASLKGTP